MFYMLQLLDRDRKTRDTFICSISLMVFTHVCNDGQVMNMLCIIHFTFVSFLTKQYLLLVKIILQVYAHF